MWCVRGRLNRTAGDVGSANWTEDWKKHYISMKGNKVSADKVAAALRHAGIDAVLVYDWGSKVDYELFTDKFVGADVRARGEYHIGFQLNGIGSRADRRDYYIPCIADERVDDREFYPICTLGKVLARDGTTALLGGMTVPCPRVNGSIVHYPTVYHLTSAHLGKARDITWLRASKKLANNTVSKCRRLLEDARMRPELICGLRVEVRGVFDTPADAYAFAQRVAFDPTRVYTESPGIVCVPLLEFLARVDAVLGHAGMRPFPGANTSALTKRQSNVFGFILNACGMCLRKQLSRLRDGGAIRYFDDAFDNFASTHNEGGLADIETDAGLVRAMVEAAGNDMLDPADAAPMNFAPAGPAGPDVFNDVNVHPLTVFFMQLPTMFAVWRGNGLNLRNQMRECYPTNYAPVGNGLAECLMYAYESVRDLHILKERLMTVLRSALRENTSYSHARVTYEFMTTLPASREAFVAAEEYRRNVLDDLLTDQFVGSLTEEEVWCVVSSVRGSLLVYEVKTDVPAPVYYRREQAAAAPTALQNVYIKGKVNRANKVVVLRRAGDDGSYTYRPLQPVGADVAPPRPRAREPPPREEARDEIEDAVELVEAPPMQRGAVHISPLNSQDY
eukprot:GHVU01086648.1.p1 GENE.GHVU01086648.1~~GHVU01086648.1.p1  ORF type:complete len:619 (-),score=63.81 GHVU01086648.1:441-2297(-)